MVWCVVVVGELVALVLVLKVVTLEESEEVVNR